MEVAHVSIWSLELGNSRCGLMVEPVLPLRARSRLLSDCVPAARRLLRLLND
jgi:hypothetical protein